MRAIDFEAARQVELLEGGGTVRQETRHWDENLGATSTMRVKEEADDYRYFREPDLVDLVPDAGVAGPGARRSRADARRTARRLCAAAPTDPTPALLDALEVVIDLGLDEFVIARPGRRRRRGPRLRARRQRDRRGPRARRQPERRVLRRDVADGTERRAVGDPGEVGARRDPGDTGESPTSIAREKGYERLDSGALGEVVATN